MKIISKTYDNWVLGSNVSPLSCLYTVITLDGYLFLLIRIKCARRKCKTVYERIML